MATSSRVNNALRADHGAGIKKPPGDEPSG